jgi:hypothetical protein
MMPRRVLAAISMLAVIVCHQTAWGQHAGHGSQRHQEDASAVMSGCAPVKLGGMSGDLESVQVESADIALYERFFEEVLKAETVFRVEHPQVDYLRGYCYHGLLIVIRQDLRTPRPTGWLQVNFQVANAELVQRQLEGRLRESSLTSLDEDQQRRIVLFKWKPDVPRSGCRVSRLEVMGPEGFMIGFNQVKEQTCQPQQGGMP